MSHRTNAVSSTIIGILSVLGAAAGRQSHQAHDEDSQSCGATGGSGQDGRRMLTHGIGCGEERATRFQFLKKRRSAILWRLCQNKTSVILRRVRSSPRLMDHVW